MEAEAEPRARTQNVRRQPAVASASAWRAVAVYCPERIATSDPYDLFGAYGHQRATATPNQLGVSAPPVDGDGDAFVVKEGGRSRPESVVGRWWWRQSAPPMQRGHTDRARP